MLPVSIHGSPPSIKYDLQSKVAQIANKDTSFWEDIITPSNEGFNDCETDIIVGI